jgi:hypothetical protein
LNGPPLAHWLVTRNKAAALSWFERRLHEQVVALRESLSSVRASTDQIAASLAELRVSAVGISAPTAGRKMCPVCCERFLAYRPFNGREKAQCPSCGALERHRLAWLYFMRRTTLFSQPSSFLHFAPHDPLRPLIEASFNVRYEPALYEEGRTSGNIDIQTLPYADAVFDFVYCSHVLEHVPDDVKAISELHRVLRPGGQCIIMIPTRNARATYEDPAITSPEQRTVHFGQWDHVRFYGTDVVQRLERPGFKVEVVDLYHLATFEERGLYGLRPEPIFVCSKD